MSEGLIFIYYALVYLTVGLFINAVMDSTNDGPDAVMIVTWPIFIVLGLFIAETGTIWYIGLWVGCVLRRFIDGIKDALKGLSNA